MTSTSFIKWVGGKNRLLPQINNIIKDYLSNHTDGQSIYVEPFLGSGSVLIYILRKYANKFKQYICSDINQPLITTFIDVQQNHKHLRDILCMISLQFLPLESDQRKAFYYEAKDVFNNLIFNKIDNIIDYTKKYLIETLANDSLNNQLSAPKDNTVLQSALFIFLNKTCFRGLYRVNSKNEFNSPYGYEKKPVIVNPELIEMVHELISKNNIKFVCSSYDELDIPSTEKLLLYLDPPYYNTYDKYTTNGFSYDEFNNYLAAITNKNNYKVILSNSSSYEQVLAQRQDIKLLTRNSVSLHDLNNFREPNVKRTEIIATNI